MRTQKIMSFGLFVAKLWPQIYLQIWGHNKYAYLGIFTESRIVWAIPIYSLKRNFRFFLGWWTFRTHVVTAHCIPSIVFYILLSRSTMCRASTGKVVLFVTWQLVKWMVMLPKYWILFFAIMFGWAPPRCRDWLSSSKMRQGLHRASKEPFFPPLQFGNWNCVINIVSLHKSRQCW